jgi:hypothetical protein
MSTDDFEKHLQRQPLRQIPDEWRAEILRNAVPAPNSSSVIRHSFLSTLTSHLSALFWPHPKAWAALGAVWILIFSLRVTSRDSAPRLADRTHAQATEVVLNFRDQEKILAELIDNNEMPTADRPKRLPPRPHSERRETTARA